MKRLGQRTTGFTIVELLIVIVVIAILAAITVVAYNGIQARANNTRTVNAVQAYVKVIAQYKIDNGTHPVAVSCLGTGYSGGVCRNDSSAYAENGSNFNTVMLAPYFKGSVPTPTQKPSAYNGTLIITGAFYTYQDASYNATGGGVGVIILGTTQCPSISGTSSISQTPTTDGNVLCRYAITV